METRKVYRSGGSTLVVSLPKKWARRAGIREGDSVVVKELEGSLIINAGEIESAPRRAAIDARKLSTTEELTLLIISHYLAGYDEIAVRMDEERKVDQRQGIREISAFLIGLEITEEHEGYLLLEVLLDMERMSIHQALKRMYLVIKSMLRDAREAMERKEITLAEDVLTREEDVDRLYFLIVRQLKSAVRYQQTAEKLGIAEQREALGYRIVVKSFERISDHIENLLQNFLELEKERVDLQPPAEMLEEVNRLLEEASKSIFRKDQRLASELFPALRRMKKMYQERLRQVFSEPLTLSTGIHYKAMLDSISRIADYASDIAEIAINMSVAVP